jgi:hypothetical protein
MRFRQGVDEMPGKVYLSRHMLRRILALFALVTGLAAVGTPAQARMMAVMSQSVVEGAQTQAQTTTAACETVAPRAHLRGRTVPQTNCRPRKPVVIVIPTIQLGPDRARE